MTQTQSKPTQDLSALDPNFAVKGGEDGLLWYDLRKLTIEGQGFADVDSPYDRLPARAQKVVRPPVWSLSQHSAGMAARFVTDAPALSARWSLRFGNLAMNHMAATGVSGLDLYARHDGRWRWAGTGVPSKADGPNTAALYTNLPAEKRELLLFLPLYNGVTQVEIGVPEGALLAPAPPRPAGKDKPICFYGTSIVHGGCASRTGMSYPAIIGRRLDRAHINLGFSGNGPMDLEMADYLAELDPCAYVLDGVPNMSPDHVKDRPTLFVERIRKARPHTPILLVEGIIRQRSPLDVKADAAVNEKNEVYRGHYERMVDAGVTRLGYLRAQCLLGDDYDGTVDGTHPTDLGFYRMAEAIGGALSNLL